MVVVELNCSGYIHSGLPSADTTSQFNRLVEPQQPLPCCACPISCRLHAGPAWQQPLVGSHATNGCILLCACRYSAVYPLPLLLMVACLSATTGDAGTLSAAVTVLTGSRLPKPLQAGCRAHCHPPPGSRCNFAGLSHCHSQYSTAARRNVFRLYCRLQPPRWAAAGDLGCSSCCSKSCLAATSQGLGTQAGMQ